MEPVPDRGSPAVEPAATRPGGRIWLKRAALVAFSLLLTLAMLEVAARLLHLGSGGFWEPDPHFGWRNIPNARGWESCYGECEVFVTINATGLRDYDYAYEKSPGTRRIIFLGDSMTAGMQVPLEATFVKILERAMNPDGGTGWQVINSAVNAFGTDNELIFYRQEAVRYQPDVVVLSVYLANDIYNNHYALETRLGGSEHKPYFTLDGQGELVLHNYPVERAETVFTRLTGLLNRYFQLPRFLAQMLNLRAGVPEALRPLIALATGNRGAEEAASQGQGAGGGRRADICQAEYVPVIEEAWAITRALIRSLSAEVEQDGARLVVLLIPAAPQLVVPQDGRDWYCDRPNQEMGAFLESEGIRYLDLLPAFREHALSGGQALYYNRDFHLNERGHALAGELLGEFFQDLP